MKTVNETAEQSQIETKRRNETTVRQRTGARHLPACRKYVEKVDASPPSKKKNEPQFLTKIITNN